MADAVEDERTEELETLSAIYPELERDLHDPFHATLAILVAPRSPVTVVFDPEARRNSFCALTDLFADVRAPTATSPVESPQPGWQDFEYLPPVVVDITLPSGYPESKPPVVTLSTAPDYLPESYLKSLEDECAKLWDEYGCAAVLFSYVDYIQQAIGDGLQGEPGKETLKVPLAVKGELLDFERRTQKEKFEAGTFDCGICLDPKRGAHCHRLSACGHVFCRACLQDFFNSSITQGEVDSIRCPDPTCGKPKGAASNGRTPPSKPRPIAPAELLEIPLERAVVQRYVDLKRKKRIESDQSTVYCPRKWCQGAARSKKHPKPASLDAFTDDYDSEPEDPATKPAAATDDPSLDRLRVCEDCEFAFCRECLSGWHGDFVRCWRRTAAELTAEEAASYDFIRKNTSPCPTCCVPTQKKHGCNHMTCPQCRSHFCYLCSAWLDPSNPYAHFSNPKNECYNRLMDLEEGDNGDGGVQFLGQRAWEAAVEIAREEEEAAEAEAAVRDAVAQEARNRPMPGELDGLTENAGVERFLRMMLVEDDDW